MTTHTEALRGAIAEAISTNTGCSAHACDAATDAVLDLIDGGSAPAPSPTARGEALARRFHETYERLAPSFGYETRTETRQFDPTTPNGRLMIAVCSEIAGD